MDSNKKIEYVRLDMRLTYDHPLAHRKLYVGSELTPNATSLADLLTENRRMLSAMWAQLSQAVDVAAKRSGAA